MGSSVENVRTEERGAGKRPRPRTGAVVAAVIAVLVGVVAGGLAGGALLGRSVTAESRLVVGDQSIRAQSVPGYALATQQLAQTYARLVSSPAEGDQDVSASPVPDSAIIRVQAKAADEQTAVHAADAAADRLVQAAAGARGGADDDTAVAAYRQAEVDLRTARAKATATASSGAAARGAAQDELAVAQARADGFAQAVREHAIAEASGSAGVTVTQRAQATSTSMRRAVALGAFAGGVAVALLVGLVVLLRGSRRP